MGCPCVLGFNENFLFKSAFVITERKTSLYFTNTFACVEIKLCGFVYL